MKAKELREKNTEELEKMLVESQDKARGFRFDISAKQVKNHREFRAIKKDIAKIQTILNETAK